MPPTPPLESWNILNTRTSTTDNYQLAVHQWSTKHWPTVLQVMYWPTIVWHISWHETYWNPIFSQRSVNQHQRPISKWHTYEKMIRIWFILPCKWTCHAQFHPSITRYAAILMFLRHINVRDLDLSFPISRVSVDGSSEANRRSLLTSRPRNLDFTLNSGCCCLLNTTYKFCLKGSFWLQGPGNGNSAFLEILGLFL